MLLPSTHYPLHDFDLRATHARTLLPTALASVSFGFVLVRVRVRTAVFGALKNIFADKYLSEELTGEVYKALIAFFTLRP